MAQIDGSIQNSEASPDRIAWLSTINCVMKILGLKVSIRIFEG